jgi:hypothetical protein
MRKEVLIAIVIGFVLGLTITFGIWTANRALKKPELNEQPQTAQEENTPAPAQEAFSLVVDSPEKNSISAEGKIPVKGQTAPGAIVVVLYEEGEKILEADKEGKFSTDVELVGGDNEIDVAAYNTEGSEIKQNLTVVYSTAEI